MLICLSNKKLRAFIPLFIAAAFNNSLYLSEFGMNVSILYENEAFTDKILGVEGVFVALGIGCIVAWNVFNYFWEEYGANGLKLLYLNMIIGAILHIYSKNS